MMLHKIVFYLHMCFLTSLCSDVGVPHAKHALMTWILPRVQFVRAFSTMQLMFSKNISEKTKLCKMLKMVPETAGL